MIHHHSTAKRDLGWVDEKQQGHFAQGPDLQNFNLKRPWRQKQNLDIHKNTAKIQESRKDL